MKKGHRKCRAPSCGKPFQPTWNSLQPTCSPGCAIEWLKTKEAADIGKKRQRQQHREDKERIKTKPELTAAAQAVFNKWIRQRDKDLPCITCGRHDWEISDSWIGGKWDAGHFLTVGSSPELRFEPLNCHKQCKSCNNGGSHKAEKVRRAYEINILDRITQKQLDWLNGPHEHRNDTHDDLRQIKQHYQKLIRELSSLESATV